MAPDFVEVLIIGGGPAGLSAAAELCRLGRSRVLVVEREAELGGIPRHSFHSGYGIRDLRRIVSGPNYARTLVREAARAGAELWPDTSVVGWTGDRRVRMTCPHGIVEIEAQAIILATGCRERPRSARLVPGTRPTGVFTTGALQQAVYLHHRRIGTTAVVVGAEHVSFSAVMTLKHAGVRVVEMTTEHPRHQTFRALRALLGAWQRIPIACRTKVTGILGHDHVSGVEVTDLDTGGTRRIACDTVVFTGDWLSESELARKRGIALNSGTAGPEVDWGLHTSATGICAAGNVLHGAESADVAALEGRRAAVSVNRWLATREWPTTGHIPLIVQEPLAWIFPNSIPTTVNGDQMPFTLRTTHFLDQNAVEVRQADRVLWRGRMRGPLIPNRSIHVPGVWTSLITDTSPITLSVV